MNFSMIVYILAWVLRIEGISLLLPFICAIIYREHSSAAAILSVSAISLVVGAVLTRKKPKKIAFLYQRRLCHRSRLLVGAFFSGSFTLLY